METGIRGSSFLKERMRQRKAIRKRERKPEEIYVSYITTNQEVLWTGRE